MRNGRFEHLYRRRCVYLVCCAAFGRDFELGDEHPSFEALVLAHVLLELVRQSVAVCVERIIAMLKSCELRADGNQLGGYVR